MRQITFHIFFSFFIPVDVSNILIVNR